MYTRQMIIGLDMEILIVIVSMSEGEVIKELARLSLMAISAPPPRELLSLQYFIVKNMIR